MDLFSISTILTSLISLLLGIFIFIKNRKDGLNKIWSVVCLCVAVWSGSLFMIINAESEAQAIFWNKSLYLGAIFIPITFYHFIVKFLEKDKKRKYFLVGGYVISFVFLYIDFFSELFIEGAPSVAGFKYWLKSGPLYNVFFGFFLVLVLVIFFEILVSYKKLNQQKKRQFAYITLAALFGFVGGLTDFFPQLFNVYPFGNYFVIFYLVMMTYTILKHQLFNLKAIATELLTFAIWIFILIRTLIAETLTDRLINGGLLLFLILFGILLIRSVLQEVKQREEMQKLAKDLEIANNQQESLIHFITHEVKGFLSKSRNIFSVILEGDYGQVPEMVMRASREGLDSGTRGVDLVKEILDSANLKKGTMQYNMTRFDLKPVVESIISDQKKNAEAKGLSVEVNIAEADYNMSGDSDQTKHVIKNLVDNSIRYTEKGDIKINLSATQEKISFSVKDTGVGITAEDKARLFTSGGRGKESLKVNVDSTGFGLFIAKEIVEAHKGKIWAESEGAGKGSTFFVELPRKA